MSRGCFSVHPARTRSTVLLVAILGWNAVAPLVELHVAIVLAHVDFELARGPAALPAVIGVTDSEKAFGEEECQSAAGYQLDVEKSEEQSSKVSEVGNATLGRLKRRQDH